MSEDRQADMENRLHQIERAQDIMAERLNGMEKRLVSREDMSRELQPLIISVTKFEGSLAQLTRQMEDMGAAVKSVFSKMEERINQEAEDNNWATVARNVGGVIGLIISLFVMMGYFSGLIHFGVK